MFAEYENTVGHKAVVVSLPNLNQYVSSYGGKHVRIVLALATKTSKKKDNRKGHRDRIAAFIVQPIYIVCGQGMNFI
jgi:hypothetical protein